MHKIKMRILLSFFRFFSYILYIVTIEILHPRIVLPLQGDVKKINTNMQLEEVLTWKKANIYRIKLRTKNIVAP